MTTHPLVGLLAGLSFLVSLGLGFSSPRKAEDEARAPLSDVAVAPVAPLGWCVIERRVFRGVSRGVSSFRFGAADREDTIAIAMERAWKAFRASTEPIRNPEAWGRTIAVRVSLDQLRHQARARQHLAMPVDADLVGLPDLLEDHAAGFPGPFDVAVHAQRRDLVRQRVQAWPEAERRLAQLLLDGRAETVTAAAWLYRAEEEADGGQGTMYPQKARVLLDARRGELEDLM